MEGSVYQYYANVRTEPVEWLWYPYIPLGKLTVLQGDPGEGKSTFALNVVARITTGQPMPDGVPAKGKRVAIYQCAEDGIADTIKPRLQQAGADCERVAYIIDNDIALTLEDGRIETAIKDTHASVFIIDPIQAFKTVKYIFLATLCGYTAEEIAEVLTDKQRPTLRGRTEWTASMVKAIMENERRWGDLEVRKRVVIDYKEKVTAKNDGLREGAYIPHYHEGIVSPEIARAAHMMRASRYKFGSVPDVYVIDSGALKGFVSISPTWSGIDNRAFQDISRQVYNEDEFCELQRRANIMNGRTHSNVVSMTLNDYRVAPGVMFMTRSDPQLTFSQRSMKLNAVCWEKLGQQKYVEFLYHPVLEVIAVRSCNATNPNAVLWDETKKSGLQLCTSAFSNAVYDKLDWMRKYKFRFRGVTRVRGGERIIFFFLDEPQILVGKDRKHLDAMDTSDSTVKYIPYKESECDGAAGLVAGIAYPENWQEQVGVSYEIKQQRGRVLDAVSSADIRNHGTKVVNPFIGVIPTHGELEDELEQIYEAM